MSEEFPPQPPAYTPAPIPPPPTASPGLADNVAAALAYVTIIPAILFLILEPYSRNPLVKFHSYQSIGLNVAAFVIQIALMIAQSILHFIPLSFILFAIIHFVVFICIFIAWLVVIIKASKGEWYKLPIIGDFAEKQARI